MTAPLHQYADDAVFAAAHALAASRAFERDAHGGGCSESRPCRVCHYDAAAAVAAVLLVLEERRLDSMADRR